jgi:bifunctional UDP-N-acetylglucosamine pyrophosphorylase/glucosamine-1-phosphate N-acetyltransferase
MSEPADPSHSSLGAIVLAAGQGTRMRSRLPKVLHPLAGQPMVAHVLDAAAAVGAADVVLVVGHGAEQVRAVLGDRVRYAVQAEQLGTGHAVLQACPLLAPSLARVLVLYGDTPLLRSETLTALARAGREATIAVLSMELADPTGYGRLVRDAEGRVTRLVEDRDSTPEQRALAEVNAGAYVFDAAWLRASLPRLRPAPGGEIYLTDLVGLAAEEGRDVVAVRLADAAEGLGVNDRVQLAQAEAALRARVRERLMRAGVTLVDPASTFVDATVEIGPDTVIHPHTFLRGRTRIGAGCEIGPSSQLEDTVVGDRCRVVWSLLEGAELADEVEVGPYSHLRPGARLARGVQIGNYAEVKNSTLHENVQQHHFSYIGDAELGRNTNVGAGTITCNFDGEQKHRTEIGEDVFIGSDTLLVAPVRMGDGSATGSGAVVTRDIPAGKLAIGMPAKVLRDRVPSPEPAPAGPEGG